MTTIADQMRVNAMEAMKFTRKYFVVELDFSEQSVQELEGLFEQVEYAIAGGASSENIELLTRIWGSYLGEVLRRHSGAEWTREGDQRVLLCGEQGNAEPHEQVRRRLGGDESADIWEYYQVTKQEL